MIEVIYSDKDLIVINKPAGVSVHAGPTVRGPTLVDFLLEKFPEINGVGDSPQVRPGIVHRLDKDTSGVMVVARNQKSFEALKDLFKKRLVGKTYWAIVCGRPRNSSGVIFLSIGRKVKNPTRRGVESEKSKIRGAREAVTEYRVLKGGEQYSLLELRPKTGRMHQLRVHMAAIHHPVACDEVYGGKNIGCPAGVSRQLLHAKSLSFSFPEGHKLYFEADPPEDFDLARKAIL